MKNESPGKRGFRGLPFPRLSDSECEKMHLASLEILERVGVRIHLDEAVRLLRRAGAGVSDGNLVRIPSKLVEQALSTAPGEVTLFNRHGEAVMPLKGDRSFFGPGSDCLNIFDHRTGNRRRPLLSDVKEGVTLCDALPNIDFVMSMLLPSDVGGTVADRYQMQVMLDNTTKPIIFVSYEFQGCLDGIEMLEAVVGGLDRLGRKPMAACYINVHSGLIHNEDSLRKLLYLASKNVPSLYIPSSAGGVKSPVTQAGTVVFDNVGVLAGLALSQLQREGAPVIVPGMSGGTFDMRTLVSSYCEPERTLAQSLARYYGLPMFALGGASESKAVDTQAAAEAALTLLVDVLAGSDIIHDLGYLESGLTFSFVQLALCDEIVSWAKALIQEPEVSAETLAVDVVEAVGPHGQFLDHEHTFRHFRERWYPSLFERDSYDTWMGRGGKTLSERASEKVEALIAEHRPEPLEKSVREKLQKILQRCTR